MRNHSSLASCLRRVPWLLMPLILEGCSSNSTDTSSSVQTGGANSSASGGIGNASTGGAVATGTFVTGGVAATSPSSGGNHSAGGVTTTSSSSGGNSTAIDGTSGSSGTSLASGGIAGTLQNTGGRTGASGGTTASTAGDLATGGALASGGSAAVGGVSGTTASTGGNSDSGGASGTAPGTGGGTSNTGGATGLGGSGGATSKSAALAPLVNAFCAAASSCCEKEGIAATLSDCESAYSSRESVVASVDSGAVTIDTDALAVCLAAYESAATSCNENAVIEACQDVFVGTKTDGQACMNAYECDGSQGPMTCVFVGSGSEPGLCKLNPHGANGDPCISTCPVGQNCKLEVYGDVNTPLALCFESDGVYCDGTATTPICAPLVPLNGDCTNDDACGNANMCDTTCKPRSTLDQPCGVGCSHELICSNNVCSDPPLGNTGVCLGYAPAP